MITEAILKISPNAQVSVNADDINQITWHNGTTPISKADIEAQLPIVELDMAMQDLRAKRNKLLTDSDWTQFNDSPLTDIKKVEWATYRTNLRDITNGLTTVDNINSVSWPSQPE